MNIEGKPEDLTGMEVSQAREYIAHYITTLKLTEKQYQAVGEALAKWTSRIQLARSKGLDDLVQEAEKEAEQLKSQQECLGAEIRELEVQIETMQKQLPGLAARERTIDPDLLEQNLLMATGYLPGENEKAEANRRFEAMEKDSSAEAALAALKAKIGLNNPEDRTS